MIREIASEEGIPESTVKTKLKRGREKLKEILIKECVIDEMNYSDMLTVFLIKVQKFE